MKLPHAVSLAAAILFVALGVTSVLLDISLRTLRIDIGVQERQLYSVESRIAEQMQTLQSAEEKKERLEGMNQAMRRDVIQQQGALQLQQEQINQGAALAQQVGSNLLHDMAAASVKSARMKELLAKHGYTVQTK